jgi:hypothetical protein
MKRVSERLKTTQASHNEEPLAVSFIPVVVVPSAALRFKRCRTTVGTRKITRLVQTC